MTTSLPIQGIHIFIVVRGYKDKKSIDFNTNNSKIIQYIFFETSVNVYFNVFITQKFLLLNIHDCPIILTCQQYQQLNTTRESIISIPANAVDNPIIMTQ